MRKPKARYYEGTRLPDNLYARSGRPGQWRYVKADGTWVNFTSDLDTAIKRVDKANAHTQGLREARRKAGARKFPPFWVEKYIDWVETQSPARAGSDSWRNACYQLRAFARRFEYDELIRMDTKYLRSWWDSRTYDQQKQSRAELSRLFQFCMGEGVAKCNPFTKDDSQPRLLNREAPAKQRLPLSVPEFRAIYEAALALDYHHLAIAMKLSLCTMMRESDILALRFDTHIDGPILRKEISKSARQRGRVGAARLQWDLRKDATLGATIEEARSRAWANGQCPYVVSYKPVQRRPSETKDHICQVLPRLLQGQFREARGHGLVDRVEDANPPTFHEVRGLSITQMVNAGYPLEAVQAMAAHTSAKVTEGYMADQDDRLWIESGLVLDLKALAS